MPDDKENISKLIRELRLRKGYTQDSLAAAINVSPQAISKWERGQTMPDISLLIPLSRILGIGVDQLLGGDRRKEFENRFQKAVPFGSRITLLVSEDALKEFPDDETFLYRRACDEFFIGTQDSEHASREEQTRYLNRAAFHFGQLHKKYPEDDNYTSMLAQTYFAWGNRDTALSLARTCKDRDRLISSFLEGEDKLRYQQQKIEHLVTDLYNALLKYGTRDSITAAYGLLDIMMGEEKTLHRSLLWNLYAHDARLCLAEGDMEGFESRLIMAYETAAAYDRLPKEVIPYRSPLYDCLSNNRDRALTSELEQLLSRLLYDPAFADPAAEGVKRRIVDEVIICRPLLSRQWADYFHFCQHYINTARYINFSTCWDMTAAEVDSMGELLCNYSRSHNAFAEQLEMNRAQVERLVGGGIMKGYIAVSENDPHNILGYCNCGDKNKYRCLGIPEGQRAVPTAPEDARVLSIVEILVATALRGCGLEQKLLDYTCVHAKKKGYTHAEVYPLERMAVDAAEFEILMSCYCKAGFTVIRDLSNETDGSYFIMQKEL